MGVLEKILNFLGGTPAPQDRAVDFWVRPGLDETSRARLSAIADYPNVPMGAMYEYAPNIRGIPGALFDRQLGVRQFFRQHGLEDQLAWNPETQQVTIAGLDVPYTFGYQGRTYAPASTLYRLLEEVLRQRR